MKNSLMLHRWFAVLMVSAMMVAAPVTADDLFVPGSWSSLASDRTAERVGDSLTILIHETSQAYDTTRTVAEGEAGLLGRSFSGSSASDGKAGLSGDYNYALRGQSERSGHMIAQISVVVDNVLPNGDLHVTGDQLININGKKIQIFLTGRVRRADISSSNTVLSTSLADATIVYGKPGLVQETGKPGLLTRMFSWIKP